MKRFIALVTLLLIGSSKTIAAQPLTYRFFGNGSGVLAGNSFTNANFSFELASDVSKVLDPGQPLCNFLLAPNVHATQDLVTKFDITGVGQGQFGQTWVFVGDAGDVGFGTCARGNLMGLFLATPAPYDLRKALAPITAAPAGYLSQFWQQPTDLGPLTFSSASYVSFEIIVAPEPGTAALAVVGLSMMAGIGFRRRKRNSEV